MKRSLHLCLTVSLAQPACSETCPEGSTLRKDGLCYLTDETPEPSHSTDSGTGSPSADSGTTPSADDSGDGGDSGTAHQWTVVPDRCAQPSELGMDPLTRTTNFFAQAHVFAELIDIEYDPERGELWAAGQGGLVAMSAAEPATLSFLSANAPHDWGQRAYKVHLGPYPAVYGSHRDLGLVAYDRSDPERPHLNGRIRTTNLAGMDHDGSHLYVAGHGGDLFTFDISDPLNPVVARISSGLANGWVPLIRDQFIYVADNTLGLVVFDRSDPTNPTFVTSLATAGGAQDLTISSDGSTLFLAVGGAGVEVVSLADPSQPQSIGLIDVGYSAIAVSADGDTLWAATQQDVVSIDISDPSAPALHNTDKTQQWAMSVDAAGGQAFVADWGYASSYVAELSERAPDGDPSTTEVQIDESGGTAMLHLRNLGSEELTVSGATTGNAGLSIEFSDTTISAGESSAVRLTWRGDAAGLDTEVCIETNDPDEPLQTIHVESGGRAGDTLGLAAPDFSLTTLDGQTVRLSEQIGHPVVLVYFATW